MTNTRKALYVLFLALFFLSGCANSILAKPVTDFTADFHAAYRGQTLSGSVTYNRQGRMNLRINAPATLVGLTIGYVDNELHLSKDGLQCTADEAYLPYSSFPAALRNALTNICLEAENNKLCLTNGKGSVSGWELVIDESGFIRSLNNADGSVSFENCIAL